MKRDDTIQRTGFGRWFSPSWGALLAAAVVVVAGCADVDVEAADNLGIDQDEPAALEDYQQAEQHLQSHRVDEARDTYASALDNRPDDGMAAAGLAVTQMLLMLELDEVTELLLEHLDAQGSIDPNELLYAEEGVLYWASRGVRWADDSDDYEGIRDLVTDELPFDDERLQSLTAFVEGLDDPVGQGLRQLVSVANALYTIESHIETALEDPEFVRLYVPGEVFHDSDLDLRLGRSELAAIRAGISTARSLVYFVAAYEHEWTLEDAFGQWRYDPPEHRYKPGYEPIDYTVEVLDDDLFRAVESQDRLAASKSSLREGVDWTREAIRYGIEQTETSTTLRWEYVQEDDALEVDELLEAVDTALDEPTELPHVVPETTLDLRPLFEDGGRTLDRDVPWFVSTEMQTSGDDDSVDDELQDWELNDRAVEKFLLEGVFDPVPDTEFEVRAGSPDPAEFTGTLFGEYWEQVEDVYFATQ